MKKFRTIMVIAAVLPLVGQIFGGCASAKSTASTVAQETAGTGNLAAQQVEIYPQIGEKVQISSITYSPDGRYVLTADSNHTSGVGSVKIWDAENGRELKTLYTGYRNASSLSFCDYAEYSPDGKTALLIMNGSEGRLDNWTNGRIHIVDVETGRTLRRISGHTGYVRAAVFSQDGRRIVSAGGDKTIKIWNTENGQEIRTISGHTDGVNSVAWGPDGRQLASVSSDKTVRIWEAETGRQISIMTTTDIFSRTLDAETGQQINTTTTDTFSSVKWSPDGRRLLVRSSGRVITLDANTRQVTGGFEVLAINDVVLSPDSRNTATINGGTAIHIHDINGRGIRQIANKEILPTLSTMFIVNGSVAYRPDGRHIIAGHWDGSIRVFDAESGRNLLTFGTRRVTDIPSAAWSPDGRQIAAASGKVIRIWDTTGRLVRTLSGHNADVGRVIWSPDGRRLASASSGDTDRSVRIWDAESGRVLRTITGPFSDDRERPDRISDIAWSPNGRMLATGSSKTAKIWDPETGRQQWAASFEWESFSMPVSFSVDSQQLFVDGYPSKIFNTANGRELKIFKEVGGTLSPDWKQIVSASEGRGFYIYDAETERLIRPGKMLTDYIRSLSYSPDGRRIMISQGNGANIYDVETTDMIGSISGHIADLTSASYSPDGKWILSASSDGSLRIWSAETFIEKARLIAFDDNEWLAMTPDGYYTASAKGDQYLNARVGNTVTGIDRYRAAFNKPAVVQARLSNSGRMASHGGLIVSVAVNPDGTRIASTALDGSIKLWDLESGREMRTITGIGGSVNAVSFSPDGRTLIHGAEDKTVRIWEAETGRAVRTISGHTDYVNEARYSPDGRRIASVADDKLVKIWDAGTGRETRTLSGHTDMVGVVAWSPDGRRIASGTIQAEKTIRIWDAESGQVLQTIPNQGGRIYGLAYSPDGKRIASCTMEDQAVKIWDAETGTLIKSIPFENRRPISLAWSPGGKWLAVGNISEDAGFIDIFDTDTDARIRQIWPGGSPNSVTWTPDGRRIIAARNFSDGQFISVYDALSGEEL
jgi:WD40 repeat protein